MLRVAEAAQGNFMGESPQPSEVEKILREGGFAHVRWREDDPDLEYNPASYKVYSRITDAFLIFQADAHGRLLENLVYRFRSPACVASLQKQLVAAGFTRLAASPPPASDDPNVPAPLFSAYDGYFYNAQYSVDIDGEVDAEGKDLHRYTVSIGCDAAMKQMQEAMEEVSRQAQQEYEATHRKKKR
ncbi:hypothetical protein GCM10028824_18440 [Hymenobacter segetis]